MCICNKFILIVDIIQESRRSINKTGNDFYDMFDSIYNFRLDNDKKEIWYLFFAYKVQMCMIDNTDC